MSDPILVHPAPPARAWTSEHIMAPGRDLSLLLPVAEESIVPTRPLGPLDLLLIIWRFVYSVCEWMFGAAVLMVTLAALSAFPLLQFLSLGYLLEASGRIARTGRLREGFVGIRPASRVGRVIVGTWLWLLPLRLVSELAASAQIIDPNGPVALGWKIVLIVLTVVIGTHIVLAWLQGGKFRHFFFPPLHIFFLIRVCRRGYYSQARDALWEFVRSLRLPYYFWLGLRGFAGAMMWLFLPVTLVALASRAPVATQPPVIQVVVALSATAGILLLIAVLLFVPFLQVRFAAENRFSAFFDVKGILAWYVRAPWAFAFSFFITLLFAIPLYLLKIEMIPRETAWMPGLVFIAFIWPARILTGWACARARRRERARHWFFGSTGWLFMPPVAAFYVMIIYFMHFTAWSGIWSLYEQHAFLLPVPFVGM